MGSSLVNQLANQVDFEACIAGQTDRTDKSPSRKFDTPAVPCWACLDNALVVGVGDCSNYDAAVSAFGGTLAEGERAFGAHGYCSLSSHVEEIVGAGVVATWDSVVG